MLTVEVYGIAMYSMTSFSRKEPISASPVDYLSIYTERRIHSDPGVYSFVNELARLKIIPERNTY